MKSPASVRLGWLIAVVSASALPGFAFDGNWPQFRGAEVRGVPENVKMPDRWSATDNVEWRIQRDWRRWPRPEILPDGRTDLAVRKHPSPRRLTVPPHENACHCAGRGSAPILSTRRRAAPMMLTALEALGRLREGNRRFVTDQPAMPALSNAARRVALTAGQEPFAIILGCSDSRVPAELVFDQGFGDLFVIRVAGNIVAPSQVGSVEFAASRYGTRLVVVMGHSQCGAILATLEELQGQGTNQSKNLRSIVDRVRPSVETLLSGRPGENMEALVREAVRANVRASVEHLSHGSELLEKLFQETGLLVVGAEYSLETGVVEFFDNVPDAG